MEHFYQNINGWFDFQSIYSDIVNKFESGSHFVEIGAWLGKSTSFMAVEIINSEKNIKFDCVDTWEGSKGSWDETEYNLKDISPYQKFLENVKPVKDYINPIQGWSYNVVKNYEDKSLDFVFIDGAHDYESVIRDINDWFPKIKDNGIISGHDYNIKDWPGVVRAVNEFFGEKNIRIIKNNTGSWIVNKKDISKQKICVMSCCYNEEDILPFYLDYYTNFIEVDKIILYDGGSIDNTPNIIKDYPNVEFIVNSTNKMDERDLTNLRNNGWKKYKNDFDWVIVCDMDEFIYHPNLKDKLKEYKKNGITIPQIQGFDMISNEFPIFKKGEFIINKIKTGIKDSIYLNKKAVFDCKKVDINYMYGTHDCNPTGDVVYSFIEEIKLLQYKWLSYDFMTKKSLNSSKRLSDWNLEKGAGSHYKIYSEISMENYMIRYNSSINVIDNNIQIDCGDYIGDPEQLKIQQLELLEYFMNNEENIPYNSVYVNNEIFYERKISLKNKSDKSKLLIPYLLEKGYEQLDDFTFKKGKNQNKDIYIFSHNYLVNNWKNILEEQLNKIVISGLYKNTTKLFFFAFGDDEQWELFIKLIKSIDIDNKIETKRFDDNFYEYYTLQYLWDFCQNINDSYVLYFHLKGVWSEHNLQFGDDNEHDPTKPIKNPIAILEWRKCLDYFNIERWYNSIDKLKEGYDIVGALYSNNEECPMFFGNFWWSNSDYIKKLNRIDYKVEDEKYDNKLWCRIKCEKWIHLIENKYFNIYSHGNIDLYYTPLDPKDYRDDINPVINILTSSYKRYDKLIESINSVINQTYKNWEMLICSDGYDEKTKQIIENFKNQKIKYFYTDRTKDGGTTQKNYLTQISTGKYLVYLDDDNIIYPNYLETVVNNFDSSTGMVICKIDYDGLDHCLPIENKLILGKIDTLNFVVDKYYTKYTKWKYFDGQEYEFMKICQNNILNHNKNVKFIPNILGKHRDYMEFNINLDELWNCSNNEYYIQQKEQEWKDFLNYIVSNIQLNNVLEIGSYELGTTSSFVKIFKNVFSIDINKGHNWDDFKNKNNNWIYYIGDSSSNYILNKIKESNIKFDLIFIDGDHTYNGVKNDFQNYKQFLNDDGIIAFHDILETEFHKEHGCRVDLFWNEIKNKYDYIEDIDISDINSSNIFLKDIPKNIWGGIGILKNINKKITLFSHNYLRFNWLNILKEQISELKYSGLYESCNKIISTYYSEPDDNNNRKLFEDLIKKEDYLHKWELIELFENNFEYDILNIIKKHSDNNNDHICYFHLKGVCSEQFVQNIGVPYWRKYLNHFIISGWKDNVEKLKEYDIDCLDYNINQMHQNKYVMGGHFFWTKSEYIKTLQTPTLNDNRYVFETWINSNEKCKVYQIYNCNYRDLYLDPIYEHEYIKIKNIIFFHIATIGRYQIITDEIFNNIFTSGLINDVEKIYVSIVGEGEVILPNNDKISITYRNNSLEVFEFPTLELVKDFCKNNDHYNVLYLHTKGVSHDTQSTSDWRKYMTYFNVYKYQDCLNILKEYDTCGVNLIDGPFKHYSGNFWWAKSKYIKMLPDFKDFDSIIIDYDKCGLDERNKCEFWLCLNNGKHYEMWYTDNNFYNSGYPESQYKQRKIYDCFNFFNELDLLDIRLNTLYDYVDKFIIIEATKTHSGNEKELYFENNKKRFEKFNDKIIHIIADDLNSSDSWINEQIQKNKLYSIIKDYDNDDMIMVTDVDEIPNIDNIKHYLNNNKIEDEIYGLSMNTYYYYLNNKMNVGWSAPYITTIGNIKKYNDVIQFRFSVDKKYTIDNAGWHFSFLGDYENIKLKINSFAHTEYSNIDINTIKNRIDNNIDLFDRKHHQFEIVQIDDSFPKYLLDNLTKYEKYIKKPQIDMKSVIVMTSHPNFKTSEEITKQSIESLKPLNTNIILATHCPISLDLQSVVTHFVFDKNNPLIRHDYYEQSWMDKEDYYALIKLHKNDNDLQHALAVYINYYNGILEAKSLGYTTAICTNFDIVFDKEDLNIITDKINEMYKNDKKSFFMTSNANEGIHYKTIFFITDVDFFLNNFKYVTNEIDYNKLTREVGSETNCLENFFYQTLKNSDKLLLQQINENELFSKSKVNLFSNIEYFTVLPLRNDPNSFVIWFSSANSLDDNRDLTIKIFDGNDCTYVKNDLISKNYVFFKKVNFKKNHKYTITCQISYDDITKEKKIIVDNIYNLKENGDFWDKKEEIIPIKSIIESEVNNQKIKPIGIYVVNQLGLGDFMAITPILRKLYNIYEQKIAIFGFSLYEEFLKNNPYVEKFYVHGTYNLDDFKENYDIYNIFDDNWNAYYYYDLRQLCARSFDLYLKESEMKYDYFPDEYIPIEELPMKYVCINPYKTGIDRNWEIEKWQELIDKLNNDEIYVVTIGKGDENKNGDFYHLNIKFGIDLCGDKRQNNLSQTWYIINKSEMFISFDCGMYILAGTTNTQIVQLGWYGDEYYHQSIRNKSRNYKYSCVRGNCDVYCLTDPKFDLLSHGNIKSRHLVQQCVLNRNFICKPDVNSVYNEIKRLI